MTLSILNRYDASSLIFYWDSNVDELNELLKPSWGAEKWILEGWNKITREEKTLIKNRMSLLFENGLPFELKHDKLLYIYTFSLLAQLEVLAIQVPLKFEDKMLTPQFKQQMRTQLLDEIFHGMVFTKIVYLLCAPYAFPPAYNEHIESLCDFIRNEECPKIGLVLLNLVAEGWIEEVFISLHRQNVAPKVFEVILEDEHRHVCEADLYHEIGIPSRAILREKLKTLEGLLLDSLTLEPKYLSAVTELLGVPATEALVHKVHAKHTKQLQKLRLIPGEQWRLMMKMGQEIFDRFRSYTEENRQVEMSPIRKIFMTQWGNPDNPTMVAQFNMDVSCLDVFEKKYPAETLTTLMLQASSLVLSQEASFRSYLNHKKLYQCENSYVAIVVKLPNCHDHVGNIVFRNCHLMTVLELTIKIRRTLQMMMYCYKKREELEQKHPHLKHSLDQVLYDFAHDTYLYPMVPGTPILSLSSIGFCGYSQAVSPLRREEGLKITLLTVERKPVWSKDTQAFEAKDIMPVSISADHRIFDGNLPMPKIFTGAFQTMFQQMLTGNIKPVKAVRLRNTLYFTKTVDRLLSHNLELGYRVLAGLQTGWPEFMDIEDIFSFATKKVVGTRFETWMS